MNFYLQFVNAQSNEPIIEYSSPLPLLVPRKGEEVRLFEYSTSPGPRVVGTVDRVATAYRPAHEPFGFEANAEFLEDRALRGAPEQTMQRTLNIVSRVWLTISPS